MRGIAKRAIKRLGRLFGLDVRRLNPAEHNDAWLRHRGIRSVLDIGANTGQFAALIHGVLPEARIYAFEPLGECYAQLRGNTRHIAGLRAFNVALGEAEGTVEMHRCAYTPSSSVLEMCDLCKEAFPFTRDTATETVAMRRLDDVASDLDLHERLLVKIDVQGFEDRVILGGRETLAQADVLIVETACQELYRGQAMFGEIHALLAGLGFAYAGAMHQLRNPADGSILQADSIFLKPSPAGAPLEAGPARREGGPCA